MPFLDKLQLWADERPHDTAVVVGTSRLTWAGLRDAATMLLQNTADITVLAEPNSARFVERYVAAVAGDRRCAVLDPEWPLPLIQEVAARIGGAGKRTDTQLVDGNAGSTFLIGLTSGTTSVPKAFTRSRSSWQVSFEASIEFFGLSQEDRTLAPGPLSASLNLYALSECLYAGAAFHTLESFDVGAAHAAITHDGITRLVLVPTMLRLLSERGLAGEVDASGIRSIVCAGSKLDARTLEAARRWAPHAAIFEYYGASELSFVSGTRLAAGEPLDAGGTGIGLPFPGVELRILDDSGRPLPEGGHGNICVRSGMVSNGYLWGDDGQALRCLDGWYTVGDQGYLEEGTLHILGRRSDMIITSGKNVYPHEVELALASVPGIEIAVAAGAPDDIRGQKVIAGVVPSYGAVTAIQLRSGLDGLLARDKRPLQYYVLSELPVTDRGKVSRMVLLDWIKNHDARAQPLG
ncbi:acyl-CoA synthetase (AMP-forming)/AMP-acid ligase II [Paenarthrobacter nitroguajacolicus]|uniref:class I adenylate-forming enzyme family protein n=1 Tax=Paenarthrobacter nitroguajacolicus TaxID=211146 RepID=UPI0028653BE2|nr:AMP-binding protein [Paenarthrobacter nitroguajacolicus]MDR6987312.1 acyl-CoA synthetase (AMP-forming)/AMP-acid ligase II [Paenarthrobacter nitroguajacolicus]